MKIHQLLLIFILVLVVRINRASAIPELTDMMTDFLEGDVEIVDHNYEVTRFRIVKNNAVIDVHNGIHIRLVDNPYNLPKTFSILAPMTAVDIVDGEVPSSYIRKYTLKHYIALREKYDSHIPQSGASSGSEEIINKKDADLIFSLNKAEWDAYAKKMVLPDGWTVKLSPQDTGISVMAFDPKTNMGLSIQPLYDDNTSPPTILMVGSYYTLGFLPDFTDDFKNDLEKKASDDLGSAYSVLASYKKMPPFELIELVVTRN